jgi:hypothetical protein
VTAEALLLALATALREEGIPFMLTGSVASAYHGAGRSTMDIDFVIDPLPSQLQSFIHRIKASGAYVSPEAAHEALTQRAMFNVVDVESGWKGDFIVRRMRPFSVTEFERRQPIEFQGILLDVATLEDLVLSKLEWAKLGDSSRQVDDVRALLRLRGEDLDREYVRHWVDVLGLQAQWAAVSE